MEREEKRIASSLLPLKRGKERETENHLWRKEEEKGKKREQRHSNNTDSPRKEKKGEVFPNHKERALNRPLDQKGERGRVITTEGGKRNLQRRPSSKTGKRRKCPDYLIVLSKKGEGKEGRGGGGAHATIGKEGKWIEAKRKKGEDFRAARVKRGKNRVEGNGGKGRSFPHMPR